MDNIMEFLPFLIPLAIVEFALLGYTLYHILTHKQYKHGNRTTVKNKFSLLYPSSVVIFFF